MGIRNCVKPLLRIMMFLGFMALVLKNLMLGSDILNMCFNVVISVIAHFFQIQEPLDL